MIIPCQEKNPEQKILIFHDEIRFSKFRLGFFREFSDFPVEMIKISQMSDVSIELFIEKSGKYVKIQNSWKISIEILEINFRHEQLIFFAQDFFPGKV